MKYMKRALSLVLAVLVVMSVMVIPAFAANTSDVDFWYYNAPTSSYNRITGRQKTDTTAVYVCVSESANNIVRTRAYGQNSAGTSYQNCTLSNGSIVDYVYCYEDVDHSIRTMINEYGWGYASLGFRSTSSAADTVSGWWSPDSSRTYTIATN